MEENKTIYLYVIMKLAQGRYDLVYSSKIKH